MTWFRICLPGNCSCCAALWLNLTHFEELAVFAWADWAGFIQGSLLQVLDTLRRSCVSWCTWNNEGKYLANATPLVTHSNVKDGVWCGNKHMLLNHYVTVLCMLNWAIKACRNDPELFQTCHTLCSAEWFPLPRTPSRLSKHSTSLQLLSGIFVFVFTFLCAFSVATTVDYVSVGWMVFSSQWPHKHMTVACWRPQGLHSLKTDC